MSDTAIAPSPAAPPYHRRNPYLAELIAHESLTRPGSGKDPDVTRINPAKLVVGLAAVLEARGVMIHEHTRVTEIEPGRVDRKSVV